MNVKPNLPRRSRIVSSLCAALAAGCAITSLLAVSALFESKGAPFDELLAAERSCEDHAFASERHACMRAYLTALHHPMMAGR